MNYNMQGITEMIPELFMMMKSMKVEIKKEHQVLMVDKITSFKKKGKKGRRGTSKRTASELLLKVKKPKSGPKPETKCFYCKGTSHWKRNYPSIWWIRRMA